MHPPPTWVGIAADASTKPDQPQLERHGHGEFRTRAVSAMS